MTIHSKDCQEEVIKVIDRKKIYLTILIDKSQCSWPSVFVKKRIFFIFIYNFEWWRYNSSTRIYNWSLNLLQNLETHHRDFATSSPGAISIFAALVCSRSSIAADNSEPALTPWSCEVGDFISIRGRLFSAVRPLSSDGVIFTVAACRAIIQNRQEETPKSESLSGYEKVELFRMNRVYLFMRRVSFRWRCNG